jgi:hypothetical protein
VEQSRQLQDRINRLRKLKDLAREDVEFLEGQEGVFLRLQEALNGRNSFAAQIQRLKELIDEIFD